MYALEPAALPPWGSALLASDLPPTAKAGARLLVEVTVRKTGALAWSPNHARCPKREWPMIRLGCTVLRPDGSAAGLTGRAELMRFAARGCEVTFVHEFQAPSGPGTYRRVGHGERARVLVRRLWGLGHAQRASGGLKALCARQAPRPGLSRRDFAFAITLRRMASMSQPQRSFSAGPVSTHAGIPRVSVIMTVYQDLRFLDEAVESVLRQELADFELIIVDDGNPDATPFRALARRDPRVRIVTNPVNLGAAAAANRGIEFARADIIARLDADDVAERAQLRRLVQALDEDSELGLVGSAVAFIDEEGRSHGLQAMPETDVAIRWTILFHNPFFHSATAFRRRLFEAAGRYIAAERVSNDHYLWFHMLPLCRARNLPEPLLRYRLNARGLTARHLALNPRARTHAIREACWKRIGLVYDLHDDPVARDLSGFLRGGEIPAARRRALYGRLLNVLQAFLAVPGPMHRRGDVQAGRDMARALFARMRASPPLSGREMLALCGSFGRIDGCAAARAAAEVVAEKLVARIRRKTSAAARVASRNAGREERGRDGGGA